MKPELYKIYKEKVVPALKTELALDNIMRVPKIEKVVINVGYGRNTKDKAFIERVERTLTLISGQRPIHNKAKKSISNFKIREGMEIGVSVTLRGAKMYEFLYKLINLTFPRVRDFRGIDLKSFDNKFYQKICQPLLKRLALMIDLANQESRKSFTKNMALLLKT